MQKIQCAVMAVRIILSRMIGIYPMVAQNLDLRPKAYHLSWSLNQLACNVHIVKIVRPPMQAAKHKTRGKSDGK